MGNTQIDNIFNPDFSGPNAEKEVIRVRVHLGLATETGKKSFVVTCLAEATFVSEDRGIPVDFEWTPRTALKWESQIGKIYFATFGKRVTLWYEWAGVGNNVGIHFRVWDWSYSPYSQEDIEMDVDMGANVLIADVEGFHVLG